MTTSESINEIAAALSKAQSEFPPITRNRTVTVRSDKGNYSFDYATLDHIIELTKDARAKNGLSISWACHVDQGGLVIAGRLMHSSGQWIEGELPVPASETLKAQQMGSALTYRKRYILDQLLGISASEDDDANSEEGNHSTGKERPPAKKAPAQPAAASEAWPPAEGSITRPAAPAPAQGAKPTSLSDGDVSELVQAVSSCFSLADLEPLIKQANEIRMAMTPTQRKQVAEAIALVKKQLGATA